MVFMAIIDFHSHILPGIDDGSRDVSMSLELLRESRKQGISTIVATPHFYAGHDTINEFLNRRHIALERLQENVTFSSPTLICGAEVYFFNGIGHADGMERFCIEGTNLLLLEMPFRAWSRRNLYEVELLSNRGMVPIIAHLERFYRFQKDKELIDELLDFPVYIQINAESLLSWRTRHQSLKLFKAGQAHLLGSDCHNITSRPQNLVAGRAVLERKIGRKLLTQIDQLGKTLLEKY